MPRNAPDRPLTDTPLTTGSPRERVNQKARTRAAIIAAAVEIAESGRAPTVSDAADLAQVGRTTAYRYFPTQDHLLYAVILGSVPDDVRAALDDEEDAQRRVRAVIRTLNEQVRGHEQAFRANLRLSLERAAAADPSTDPRRSRIFGGRRVRWLEEALGPARDQLTPAQHDRLVAALALCMGVEPYIVLSDACGLVGDERDEVMEWVVDTLIDATFAEARGTAASRPRSGAARGRTRPRARARARARAARGGRSGASARARRSGASARARRAAGA